MTTPNDKPLTAAVSRIHPIASAIKAALLEKGVEVEGDLLLNKIPGVIRGLSAGNPVRSIEIADPGTLYGGIKQELEISSLVPSNATVNADSCLNRTAVEWNSDNDSVVTIVQEAVDGMVKTYAMPLGIGDANITAKIGDVTGQITVHNATAANNLYGLQTAVRLGLGPTLYPVGTVIDDEWTDTAAQKSYSMPLIVAHYGDVTLADGTIKTGVYLIRKNATPFDVQFNAKDPASAISSIRSFGYNRYSASALHKWLNSDASKGGWWIPSVNASVAPDIASTKDGYMKGCSKALLDTITDVKVSVSANTVTDGGVTDEVVCKFFLPAREQLHYVPGARDAAAAGVEGEAWDYFKTTASPDDAARAIRMFATPSGTVQACWLCSAARGDASSEWLANSDGGVMPRGANYNYGCAPACVVV